MPSVARPDGVEIHWESRGDGPLILILPAVWAYPAVYDDLIDELARDRRVVTYHPRGFGLSSAAGPYDVRTDSDDLAAVAEAAGGSGLALAVANGLSYAVRVAAERPDLISTVAALGPAAGAVLPRDEMAGAGMLASTSVGDMLMKMLETDPRSASHAIVSATNPQMGESELHERVDRLTEYASPEAVAERARAWLEGDVSDAMTALGDRLWILHGGGEGFEEDPLTDRVAARFPKAHLEPITAGPLSRPEVTAAILRRIARDGG
jgi:pimeloyl-ACP methyl ester carboxylesterase